MLNRQYGIAASSSIVQVVHPEDSQPNERIQSRNRNLPPKLNTVRPPRFNRTLSNSSRLGTQLARRGTWNTRVSTRPRQESSSWSNAGPSGPLHNFLPEAPTSGPTSSFSTAHPATHPVQQSTASTWVARYRSLSPKLPLEPIRRRTPLDAPRYRPADRPPLPGRKRKATEVPPSELPPPQKLKVEQPELPPLPPVIKQEYSSPEPIVPPRKLVTEACSFWPTPDNCRKSVSDYAENRREFAKTKNRELLKLGLRRTRAFFREDGLVIEWRSKVPVWNDTLLPETPLPQLAMASKTFPAGVSPEGSNPGILKRKWDVIEIIDVDALPTESTPLKKSRPSDPELATASAQKQSSPEQKTPSPKKRKVPERHWSAGLSKEDIRKLGRGVEASSLKPLPPPSSLPTPPNSCDNKASDFVAVPVTPSPPKRLALPTRLTPSERKIVSAAYSGTASSSPDRDKEARSTLDTATSSGQYSGRPATDNSNSSQETVPKPPLSNDAEVLLLPQSTGAFLESTNEVDAGAEMAANAHFDASVDASVNASVDASVNASVDAPVDASVDASFVASPSNVDAALPGGEHLCTLGCDNNDSAPQISPNIDPQIEGKSENLSLDEAALFEAESQEIERLCTEDNSMDLPEYDMAEDFLRRFINLIDADRNELKMAYSNDALLSFREPSTEPGTLTPSSSSNSTLHFGRTEIIDKLNGLIGYHFSPVGVPNNTIDFDIAVLSQEVLNCNTGDGSAIDKEAVGGVLATLHSQILRSGSGQDRTMTLHQSFVLRRRTELDDGESEESTSKVSWPLIVISHHMILRTDHL